MKKVIAVALAAVAFGGVAAAENPSAYPEGTIRYTVKRGDTLAAIAREYLGDARRWREIADANGVSNPRRLPVGKVLTIRTTEKIAGRRDLVEPSVRRAPAERPATASPTTPQEPIATDPAFRRPPGARPELAPPARPAPPAAAAPASAAPPAVSRAGEPPATAYPAEERPVGRSRTAARMQARRGPPTAYGHGRSRPIARPAAWRGAPGGRATLAPPARGTSRLVPAARQGPRPVAREAEPRLGAGRSSPTAYPRQTSEGVAWRGAISERLRGGRRGARI